MNQIDLKLLFAFIAIIFSSSGWTQDLTQWSKEELILKIEKLEAENKKLRTKIEGLDNEKIKEPQIEMDNPVFTPDPFRSNNNESIKTDSLVKTSFGNSISNQGIQGDGADQNSTGTAPSKVTHNLNGRQITSTTKLGNHSQSEGVVAVNIWVDRNGNVTKCFPGVKGSTTTNSLLYKVAKTTAMKCKFDINPNAPEIEKGVLFIKFIAD